LYKETFFGNLARGQYHHTFYKQLLRTKIPKEQKRLSSCQSFLCLWDLCAQKAARRTLMKLTPEQIINVFLCNYFCLPLHFELVHIWRRMNTNNRVTNNNNNVDNFSCSNATKLLDRNQVSISSKFYRHSFCSRTSQKRNKYS